MQSEILSQYEHLKVPPNSTEAEQYVLGGLLLEPDKWEVVESELNEVDFYRQDHRLIFRSIAHCFNTGVAPDVLTLSEYLNSVNELENAGGLAYLGTMAKDTPSAANIKAYVDIVRERSLRRQAISLSSEIAEDMFNQTDVPIKQLINDMEQKVFALSEQTLKNEQSMRSVKSLLKEVLADIDERSKLPLDTLPGESTGFADLDELISGVEGGELVIIAGRPSMGKTTLAMNIAEFISSPSERSDGSKKQGGLVPVFSMEMPRKQIVQRSMSSTAGVPLKAIKRGRIDENQWPRIGMSVKALANYNMWIDDSPALSVADIRARCRRLRREHEGQHPDGISAIVIDYIQLMSTRDATGENRATLVGEISRNLKALAKELDCPVIALSQLNRSLESRPNKRPLMSDLRESGAIEQDADKILFVYRDEVYNPESTDKGTAEVIIGKQRDGELGTVRLTFEGKCVRFKPYTPDVYAPEDMR